MGWTAADIPDQRGKVAIVTGANSGLGFEAARELARNGATVVMAVRDLERGEAARDRVTAELPAADLQLLPLDLASLEAVRAFVAAILADHDDIDILLNNAGVMATPAGETEDGFETQVGINHLGHFVLTQGLMPVLERAPAARVVTLTSFGRLIGRPLTEERTRLDGDYDAWRAYGHSKLANYHFGIELARRLGRAGSSVLSLVAHPGIVHTNLQVATVESGGGGIQGPFWRFVARHFGTKASDGVRSALRAATDPAARNGQFFGPRWFIRGAPVASQPSPSAAARADIERMWHTSEAVTGARFDVGTR